MKAAAAGGGGEQAGAVLHGVDRLDHHLAGPPRAAWSAAQATLSRASRSCCVQRVTLVPQPGQQVQPRAAAVRRDPQRQWHVGPQLGDAVGVGGQAAVAGGHVPRVEVEQREVQPPALGQLRQPRGVVVARPPQLDRAEPGRGGPGEPLRQRQARPEQGQVDARTAASSGDPLAGVQLGRNAVRYANSSCTWRSRRFVAASRSVSGVTASHQQLRSSVP